MNQAVPLGVILWVVAAAVAAVAVYLLIESARRTKESLDELTGQLIISTEAMQKAVAEFTPVAAELRANMAGVPKLLETVARIGSAQLEIMQSQQQRPRAGNPPASPFGPARTTGQRDPAASQLEYDATQLMRAEGITREEALLRLNGANSGTVWDAGLFRGW